MQAFPRLVPTTAGWRTACQIITDVTEETPTERHLLEGSRASLAFLMRQCDAWRTAEYARYIHVAFQNTNHRRPIQPRRPHFPLRKLSVTPWRHYAISSPRALSCDSRSRHAPSFCDTGSFNRTPSRSIPCGSKRFRRHVHDTNVHRLLLRHLYHPPRLARPLEAFITVFFTLCDPRP